MDLSKIHLTITIKIDSMWRFMLGYFSYIELVSFMYMIRIMVFNATVNNISVISGRIVLLIAVPGENNQPAVSHWHTLSHSVVSSTPSEERDSNSLYNMYYTIYKIKSFDFNSLNATCYSKRVDMWCIADNVSKWIYAQNTGNNTFVF